MPNIKNNLNEIMVKDEKGLFRVISLKPETEDKGQGQEGFKSSVEPKARFYFSPEDEEEIRKYRQQSTANRQQRVEELINQKAQEIINRVEIEGEESLKERLKRVIVSRLKEARTLVETKIVLQRSNKLGGLGLGEEQVMKVLKEIEKERGRIEELITNNKLLITKKEKKKLVTAEMQKKIELERDFRASAKTREPLKPIDQKSFPAIDIRPPVPKTWYSQPSDIPQVKRPPLIFSEKKKLIDVKTSPRVIGPTEELQELTLEDFRKLGSSPGDAIKRIQEKIDLLEDESLIKKAEGIKAWKESEPYKIYVKLGKESMEQGKPVEAVANKERTEGKPTLTCEEFEVIADLNKSLSF